MRTKGVVHVLVQQNEFHILCYADISNHSIHLSVLVLISTFKLFTFRPTVQGDFSPSPSFSDLVIIFKEENSLHNWPRNPFFYTANNCTSYVKPLALMFRRSQQLIKRLKYIAVPICTSAAKHWSFHRHLNTFRHFEFNKKHSSTQIKRFATAFLRFELTNSVD